jgi:hypothetical protein
LAVGGVMVFVLVLLAVVVAAIKQEPQGQELTSQPPSAITAWVRHLLGVYVRKPDQPAAIDEDRREPPRWPRGPRGMKGCQQSCLAAGHHDSAQQGWASNTLPPALDNPGTGRR